MGEILIAALKVGTASLASLVAWMVDGKVLALQLGAAGVGLFGMLRQLVQYLRVVASINGQTAKRPWFRASPSGQVMNSSASRTVSF